MPPDAEASSSQRVSDGSPVAVTFSLAHASLVGRQAELQQLKAAFEVAASGQGALMLLVGEPGIGKTALCEQLCRFVSASGGRPLVGHCYEEGSFRRPYQPFVEAFGAYASGSDSDILTADLGSGATDLARIVPALIEQLDLAPRPPGDAEEDRWRLLDAAMHLLRSAAAHYPLLLVLEDLHDADRGTLDLLLHVTRNVGGARLLVVGTYRDVQVDRAHPLSAALTELHRASNVSRVHLRGLTTDEVQRLLAETSQQTIPRPFAELVHRQPNVAVLSRNRPAPVASTGECRVRPWLRHLRCSIGAIGACSPRISLLSAATWPALPSPASRPAAPHVFRRSTSWRPRSRLSRSNFAGRQQTDPFNAGSLRP
jgi:hypothetical protein